MIKNMQTISKMKLAFLFRLNNVSLQDQIIFVKRLSLLLKAGVPMLRSLRMISNQITNPKVKFILESLTKKVESGQYLSSSLADYKIYFNQFFISLIQIGEFSGTLQENLVYLEQELSKHLILKRKIRGVLIYPTIIIFATVSVSLFLTLFLFPKILPIFSSLEYELPWTTLFLIWISTFLLKFWWSVLLVLFLCCAVFIYLLKKNWFKLKFDYLILKIPVIGKLLQYYYLANICRTLGLMLKTDIRIQRIFQLVSESSTNLCYKQELENLSFQLNHGQKISENFAKHSHLFPSMMVEMVAIGESTGSLSDTFNFLSEIFESNLEDLIKNFSTIIEPLLMIVMGVLVGFVAISIIIPIYGFTQNIKP